MIDLLRFALLRVLRILRETCVKQKRPALRTSLSLFSLILNQSASWKAAFTAS